MCVPPFLSKLTGNSRNRRRHNISMSRTNQLMVPQQSIELLPPPLLLPENSLASAGQFSGSANSATLQLELVDSFGEADTDAETEAEAEANLYNNSGSQQSHHSDKSTQASTSASTSKSFWWRYLGMNKNKKASIESL